MRSSKPASQGLIAPLSDLPLTLSRCWPQAAHKEAMGGVERKLVEEKTRLQREAHAQLMEIKRNTDEEVRAVRREAPRLIWSGR